MGPKSRLLAKVAAALGVLLLACLALAFGVRWSTPCDEQRAQARAAWSAYAAHVHGARAQRAADVLEHLEDDLEAAVDAADAVGTSPEPSDAEGAALYREAMETLTLTDGACAR